MDRACAREYTIDCGDYRRVHLFPVRRKATGRRGKRCRPTSEVQAKLNKTNSINRLTDLANLNFSQDDCALHLTYRNGEMPETAEDAMRLTRNFLRCLRRLWSRKTGRPEKEFRYVIVDEVSTAGRYHHHCLISGGLTVNEIGEKWRYGLTNTAPLEFDETGLCGLAAYLCKDRLSYRRWRASKNLAQPAERQNDDRVSMKELYYINEHPDDVRYIEERYPGWRVSPYSVRATANPEIQAAPFVSFLLYREEGEKLQRRRARHKAQPSGKLKGEKEGRTT